MAARSTSMSAGADRAALARWIAIVAAIGAAALYLLIGIGVLWVGDSTTEGGAPDLLGFGVAMGILSVVTAVFVWRFQSRIVLAAVGAFQLLVLVGYFALASLRNPPFEAPGLLVKVCQLVVLGAVAYLLVRGEQRAPRPVVGSSGRA